MIHAIPDSEPDQLLKPTQDLGAGLHGNDLAFLMFTAMTHKTFILGSWLRVLYCITYVVPAEGQSLHIYTTDGGLRNSLAVPQALPHCFPFKNRGGVA